MAKRISFILLLSTLFLNGCSFTYLGDGQFVDNGITAATARYVLTLPKIDLCKKETYRFQIGRLPSEWWSASLRYPRRAMKNAEAEKIGDQISKINIKLRISDAETGLVFHEYNGDLKMWGSTPQYPQNFFGSGIVNADSIDWNLDFRVTGLFDPKRIVGFPYGTYSGREIVLSIDEPLPELQPYCEATLHITSSGWK